MRRAMTYAGAWAGATSLAVLLVWFGARPVLRGAVFGSPPARSVVGRPTWSASADLVMSRSPDTARATPHHGRHRTAHPAATPSASASGAGASQADTRSYRLGGGQVVLALTATSARLVSATPAAGYEVHTWHGPGWLRVDFTMGDRTSSLFATWNGHPPSVQVVG